MCLCVAYVHVTERCVHMHVSVCGACTCSDRYVHTHVPVCGAGTCSDRYEPMGSHACGGQNQQGQGFTLGIFLYGSPPMF